MYMTRFKLTRYVCNPIWDNSIERTFGLSEMACKRKDFENEIPTKVSHWSMTHAQYFGLLYNRSAVSSPCAVLDHLNDFRTRREKFGRTTKKVPTLPEKYAFVKEFLMRYLTFSIIDCDEDTERHVLRQLRADVEGCKRNIESLDIVAELQDMDQDQRR